MYPTEKLSIREWAEEDRPREKAQSQGIKALSNTELLAILINTGTRESSALDVAKSILLSQNQSLTALSMMPLELLQQAKGVGLAKSITLAAAFELGRRKYAEVPEDIIVKGAKDAFNILHPKLDGLHHEEFWVIYLSTSNRVISVERCSKGGIRGTIVDVRLILKKAILCNTSSIILGHNHPSGSQKPSSQDLAITKKIKQSAELFDIKVYDHIIIFNGGYYSFSDEGNL